MKFFLILTFYLIINSSYSQSDYVWDKYSDPLLITSDNANSIDSFENNLESIVIFFYASKIRNDKEWQKVIPTEEFRSYWLKQKLEDYDLWTFTKFQLISRTEYSPNKFWVKAFFEIEYKGEIDGKIDEVTVELIDGMWIITSVPT